MNNDQQNSKDPSSWQNGMIETHECGGDWVKLKDVLRMRYVPSGAKIILGHDARHAQAVVEGLMLADAMKV